MINKTVTMPISDLWKIIKSGVSLGQLNPHISSEKIMEEIKITIAKELLE